MHAAQFLERALAVAGLRESPGELAPEAGGVADHGYRLQRCAGRADETGRAGGISAEPYGEGAAAVGPCEAGLVPEALRLAADPVLDGERAFDVPQVAVRFSE